MTKARQKTTPQISDWEEADNACWEIQQAVLHIEERERLLTTGISDLKSQTKRDLEVFHKLVKRRVRDLEVFVVSRKDEIKGRSRKLNHGVVGWRRSTKIKLDDPVPDVIERCEAADIPCVRVKKTLDRKALGALTDERLAEVGAKRDVSDVFFVEPNREVVADTAE
jgi:hypothetical protein